VRALFDEARRLGREDELRRGLGMLVLSVAPSRRPPCGRGLRPTVSVDSPFTTRELVVALASAPLLRAGGWCTTESERPLAAALLERAPAPS
jgi:hypothetical protein